MRQPRLETKTFTTFFPFKKKKKNPQNSFSQLIKIKICGYYNINFTQFHRHKFYHSLIQIFQLNSWETYKFFQRNLSFNMVLATFLLVEMFLKHINNHLEPKKMSSVKELKSYRLKFGKKKKNPADQKKKTHQIRIRRTHTKKSTWQI